MPAPDIKPTSFRLNADEIELLDAAAHAMTKARGFGHSRSDVIRAALKRLKPGEELGEEMTRWRRAYGIVFGKASS